MGIFICPVSTFAQPEHHLGVLECLKVGKGPPAKKVENH